MSQPLVVHLVFHPRSQRARELAVGLHTVLNGDGAVPGLRIPTAILAADGSGLPPTAVDLAAAERSFVVVLATDEMLVEPAALPAGRRDWPEFVVELAERCRAGGHHFLPVQLTATWPLHPALDDTSFLRALAQPPDALAGFLERRVVIDLCRFLLGQGHGARAPVRLFLSHAKADLAAPAHVLHDLVAHLDATQPVESWIDSAKIDAGARFGDEIADGIAGSAVLVILTDHYGGRPWCRREVLLAKAAQRPLVVVDALEALELRAFPYLGNAPVLAWRPGAAARAVDLLLQETLRGLHVARVLAAQARKKDVVLTAPPELATLVPLPRRSDVLYPDPPLGDEELALLAPLGHRVSTPLERAGAAGRLRKWMVALSISESDHPERAGALPQHLDAALVEISRYLLVAGAALAYGGHLGSTGYTRVLFDLVRAHQGESKLPPPERVVNYVGWPLPLGDADRARDRHLARFVRLPRPDDVADLEPDALVAEPTAFVPASSPARRFAWARGMSEMRATLTRDADARVVLGGKVGPAVSAQPDGSTRTSWYLGRIPGVVEEALASLDARRPLYVCGGFGGAAALVADLLDGRPRDDFTWDFHRAAPHAEAMRALYDARGVPFRDYPEMAHAFAAHGVAGLARDNGLDVDENRELLRTRDVARIVELLLRGMGRVRDGGKRKRGKR